MKLLTGFPWASLFLGFDVALGQASIYIQDHDQTHKKSEVASITPNTARLLFAQRLGLSQYHALGDVNEDTIEVLNQFGGNHPSPFADDAASEEQNIDRLLFIIEGVEFPEDLMEPDESLSITISETPNAAQNAKLAQDLLEQALHAGSGKTMSHIKHNLSLQGLTRSSGQRYTHAISTLKTILKTYHHQMPLASRTIVLMPPTSQKSKRGIASPSPYGTYTMPLSRRHAQSLQQTRQQQQQHESPLEEFTPSSSSSSSPSPNNRPSALQDEPVKPLPRLPKICHPSLLSASTETNNCSSHGSIYLRAPGANGNPGCWACRCSSTSITTTDAAGNSKKKTTYWGGAACQKKDVSTQFWLLATVTVALLAVVGYGVGLLVDVGEGQLPGVLGAGVGGARAGSGGGK